MTIIIIIVWNKKKDQNLIYECWRPNLKYIWLIIYKFILDKIESANCMKLIFFFNNNNLLCIINEIIIFLKKKKKKFLILFLKKF